jgi:LPS export ABC transporter protein LptC
MSSHTESIQLRALRATRRARVASFMSLALIAGVVLLALLFFYQAGFFSILVPKQPQPLPVIEKANQISSKASRVSGFDREQQPYEIAASEGYQDKDKPNLVHLQDLTGTLRRPSGKTYEIEANTGLYDTKSKQVDLAGDVRIVEPGRLTATMAKALVHMENKSLDADVPVEVEMNGGNSRISAGGMKIGDDGKTILFLNGVKARFEGDGKGDQP